MITLINQSIKKTTLGIYFIYNQMVYIFNSGKTVFEVIQAYRLTLKNTASAIRMTLLGYLKLSISCCTVRKAMISGDIWVSSGISRYDNGIRETFFPSL